MELVYRILKYITFPGAILKGIFEHLTCRIYKVPVEDIRSIQPNELCGHIEHEIIKGRGSFGMCFLPFILNLICSLLVLTPATISVVYLEDNNAFSVILMYFGFSFLANIMPLMEDAISMWESLYGQDGSKNMTSKVFLAIPAAILYAGAWLDKFGITFLLSIAFTIALPFIVQSIA